MSRVRNADEFRLRFREIWAKYDHLFGPLIAEQRRMYAGTSQEPLLDQNLEAHIRVYIVNALLQALNWRLDTSPEDGPPNLILEAPVRSQEKGTVRFLDYLGLEKQTVNPLLIVETKRPNAPLPQAWKPAATYSEILCRGLAGEDLRGGWTKWLNALRDYIRSVYDRTQKVPRRVVLTNGDWLILFLDPADAFLEGGIRDPNKILVFTNRNDIERRFNELFLHLEHQRVLGETPALTLGELPFSLDPQVVDRAMHGLQLLYIERRAKYGCAPIIIIYPVVFLRSRYGAWIRVEAPPNEYELPHGNDELVRHLEMVQRAADDLLNQVNQKLGRSIRPVSLLQHYANHDDFSALPGVIEHDPNQFLVVTGDRTHYLLPKPSVPECPYHDWKTCNAQTVPSDPDPIVTRSISPRAFFISGEWHHCAHRDVSTAKASSITAENRGRCGLRSGQEGQAFCEIWRFEQYLCCRTCVFENVCTKATVFQLPCQQSELKTGKVSN